MPSALRLNRRVHLGWSRRREKKKKASELTCNTNKTSETNRAAKSAQIRERSSITGVAEDDRLELSIRMRRNPSKDRFRMALWRPSYTLSTKLPFDTICLVLFLLSKPFHFPLRLFFFCWVFVHLSLLFYAAGNPIVHVLVICWRE